MFPRDICRVPRTPRGKREAGENPARSRHCDGRCTSDRHRVNPGRRTRTGCAARRRTQHPQPGNLPGSHAPDAASDRRAGWPFRAPAPRSRAGAHSIGANDAVIDHLTALLLFGAASTASDLGVRDTTASPPDSGAVATASLIAPHASPTAPTPVMVLPETRVDADLERARRRAPTAFVTVLGTRPDLHALSSLDEALVVAAGVHVTQYGGMGAFSTMSVRGMPPGHVTVLLDGVPLTSAAHGIVDLAGIPATAVDAIEVYRGAAPVSLGTPTP